MSGPASAGRRGPAVPRMSPSEFRRGVGRSLSDGAAAALFASRGSWARQRGRGVAHCGRHLQPKRSTSHLRHPRMGVLHVDRSGILAAAGLTASVAWTIARTDYEARPLERTARTATHPMHNATIPKKITSPIGISPPLLRASTASHVSLSTAHSRLAWASVSRNPVIRELGANTLRG